MSPSAIDVETDVPIRSKQEFPKPLKYSGSLDSYESFDATPVIGTEYPTANLVEWLNASNADDLLRDLAIKSKSSTLSYGLFSSSPSLQFVDSLNIDSL